MPLPARLQSVILSLLGALIGSSCLLAARAPVVTPRRTLGVDRGKLEPSSEARPFSVEFAAPRGEVSEDPEIVLMFSRPVRRLDTDPLTPALPARITPETAGHWEWIGTRIARFVPQGGRLLRATDYTVEVPTAVRATDGSPLVQPFRLEFATPRPVVNSLDVENKPVAPISLQLSQPVLASEVARATRVTAGSMVFPFKVRDNSDPSEQAELDLLSPLPLGVDVQVTVDASLRAVEGPRTLGKTWTGTFHSYGPFAVKQGECWKGDGKFCSGGVMLEFTSPVRPLTVRDAIRITPAVKMDWGDYNEPSEQISIPATFEPGKTYTVRVSTMLPASHGKPARPLSDIYGLPLAREWSDTFPFEPEQASLPYAQLQVGGTVVDGAPPIEVNVQRDRINRFDVTTAPVSLEDYVRLTLKREDVELQKLPGAKTWTEDAPQGKPIKVGLSRLFISSPVWHGGAVVALGTPGKSLSDLHLWTAQATDIGLSSVFTPFGELVWATSLSTGKPIPGALVQAHTEQGALWASSLATDQDGIAYREYDAPAEATNVALTARAGDGWSVVRRSSWRSLRDEYQQYFLFNDRGMYRPGDTVRFKGIGRIFRSHGMRALAGQEVELEIQTAKLAGRLDEFGAVAIDWVVPKASKVGFLAAKLCPKGRERANCAHSRLQIAEYRATEFAVEATFDRATYVRGDTMKCMIRARYLFGGAMRDAKVAPLVYAHDSAFRPPGLEGWQVSGWAPGYGSWWQSPLAGNVEWDEYPLDRDGSYTATHALQPGGESTTKTFTCEPQVHDASRQTGSGRTTALVHPAEFYLALRLRSSHLDPGQSVLPEVLAVEPDGKHRANVAIRLQLTRVDHDPTNGRKEVAEGTCEVQSRLEPSSCKLSAIEPGEHFVSAIASDPRTNEVKVTSPLYVRRKKADPIAVRTPAPVQKHDSPAVRVDRHSYAVGDTAHVELHATFPAIEALLTTSREGIISYRRIPMHGTDASIDLPIIDEMVPEATIAAVFVRGRAAPRPAIGKDPGAPMQEHTDTRIDVDPSGHHLSVSLTPSATNVRPGSNIDVAIHVADPGGAPQRSQVTVYAADEGVLLLSNYRTPDPFPTYYGDRRSWLWFADTRDSMFYVPSPFLAGHRTKPPQVRMGATSIGDPQTGPLRKDMRHAVYFNPDVRTDAGGRARVSFKLPDSLSSFRVMAVAITESSFGSTQANVTTSQPLMLRPALPRVLRIGDQVDASVLVTSRAPERVKVDVTATVDGAGAQTRATKPVHLEPGRTAELRFPVQVSTAGKATFRFAASSDRKDRDAVELERQVQAPTVVQTVALYGETTGAAGEQLGDMTSIHPNVGGLTLTLSSSPLVGIDAGFDQLIQYPYGCTEQLTSRLVPLLPLRDLARKSGAKLPEGLDAVVSTTLEKIVARQNKDGGFLLWPESKKSHPWVSIQVLWALLQAQHRGVAVDSSVLQGAIRYASEIASAPPDDYTRAQDVLLALDVLAEEGLADGGVFDSWFDRRRQLPVIARALLLHGLSMARGPAAQIETLKRELESSLRVDGPLARVVDPAPGTHDALDSNLRTTAVVLRALVAAEPHHSMGSRLARGLLSDRREGGWRSTQEAAWALIALDAWWRAQDAPAPELDARIFLGQELVKESSFRGPNVRAEHAFVPPWVLKEGRSSVLAFEARGSGTLYYEARLAYGLLALPTESLENGFAVHRDLRIVDGPGTYPSTRATQGNIPAGRLVRCDLIVATSQPREQVVVDSPLPAGLEIVDPSLAITARWGSGSLVVTERIGGLGAGSHAREVPTFVPAHTEVRDDRMLFFFDRLAAGVYRFRYHARATSLGTFVAPPAMVQEMYTPETFGRTAAEVVRVHE